jgi:hypothetical protein
MGMILSFVGMSPLSSLGATAALCHSSLSLVAQNDISANRGCSNRAHPLHENAPADLRPSGSVVHSVTSNVVSTVFHETRVNQPRDGIGSKPLFGSPLHRFVLDEGEQ